MNPLNSCITVLIVWIKRIFKWAGQGWGFELTTVAIRWLVDWIDAHTSNAFGREFCTDHVAGLATSGSFFSRDFGRIELSLGAGMAWQPVFLRKEIKYFGPSSILKWTCSCASCWLLPALSPSLVLTAEVKYSSHKIARNGEKNMTPDFFCKLLSKQLR